MLLIKKIETQTDINDLLKIDAMAEEHIYVLGEENKKNCLWRMNPMHESELKSFFGLFKKADATVWKGGYYISAKAFDLTFESILNSVDSPRKLLTRLGVRVLGINFNEDLSELAGFLGGKNELTSEEFDNLLAGRKKSFFDELQRKLDNSAPSGKSTREQIFELAVQAMTEFFPYLNIEITYSGAEEELTAEEKAFKENCRKLAEKQQAYEAEYKERQAENAYKLSVMELEESTRENEFAMKLREEDRKLAVEEKKNAFRQLQYEAEKGREQSLVDLMELEKKQAELQLEIAKINEQRKNIRTTLEQNAKFDEERIRLIKNKANTAEYEAELKKIELEKEKLILEAIRRLVESGLYTPGSWSLPFPLPAGMSFPMPAENPDLIRQKQLFEDAQKALTDREFSRADELLEEAGDYAPALNLRGKLFEEGKDFSRDLEKAYRCYKRSAALNNAEGLCRLGLCYYSDSWGKKNHDKAFELFERSAQQGYLDAIYYAGYCCEIGTGTSKNLEKAAGYYKEAADKKHMRAQHSYALCCANGWGREADIELAIEYYRKAAAQNYHRAQYNLGCCYASGFGVEKDYAKAVEYYRKAANNNFAKAQYTLGRCLEQGKGTPQNIREAISWYKSARDRGNVDAKNRLQQLQEQLSL